MRTAFLAAVVWTLSAASALASPVTLFNGVLNASADALAPSFADPTLSCPACGQGGGIVTGPVSFATPVDGLLTVTLRDLGRVGDVFEVLLDDTSLGLTSPVPIDGPTNSAGVFTSIVGAGFHAVDAWDFVLTYTGFDSPYGGTVGFDNTSTDFQLTVTFVPEPGTLALTGTALGLAGLTARRRKT